MLDFSSFLPASLQSNHSWWPMMFFVAMAAALYWVATKDRKTLPTAIVKEKE